jgi:lysophospholipase L1-like esterase
MKNMMKKNYVAKSLMALVAAGAIASCKPSLQENIPSNGEVDFSRYIAVGNSLTAGYADGGLYLEAQQNSFPEILAKQFKTVGGGEFNSPFFSEAQANGSGYLQLSGFTATGTPTTSNVTNNTAWTNASRTALTKYEDTFNNYGIPDIKIDNYQMSDYPRKNKFLSRLLSAQDANTPFLNLIGQQSFSFFSFWEGQNDILEYAYTGDTEKLTPIIRFKNLYNDAINTLTEKGAKGVVGTIGDILATPYFNVVTPTLLDSLASRIPNGKIYIKDGNRTRQPDSTDKFILPLSGKLGTPDGVGRPYGFHPQNPISEAEVVDVQEQTIIKNHTNEYNAIIREIATQKELAIVNVDNLLSQYYKPKMVNGAEISTAFITGNLFSLDGLHLTPMGNAILANAFIKAINQQYKANVPIVNFAHYRGVKFPGAAAQ